MKKTVFSLIMTAVALCGCAADSNKLHVKTDLKNVGDTLIVITNGNTQQRLTFTGKEGKFEFDVELNEVTTCYIVEPGALRGERAAWLTIPAIPGEEITIVGDANVRYDVGGSKFYQQYHEADIVMEKVQNEQNEFATKVSKMVEDGVPEDSVMKIYQEGMEPLQKKFTQTILDFIKAHPDYEASAAIIRQLPDPDTMKEAVALLSPAVRDGRTKPLYQTILDQVEARQKAEEEAAKKQAAGVEAPDFTLNDINGKPLLLSSLRGKHVILDFWGSWCGWCIKGFPDMKEYYKKYAGKFEILGIDCNDPEDKWKEAVKKYELPWLHVYNPRDSKVLEDYGIQGFPTKIIVGPDGKIVKTIVGEDPAFYTLLDELFK